MDHISPHQNLMLLSFLLNAITGQDNESLSGPASEEEVRQVVFSIQQSS